MLRRSSAREKVASQPLRFAVQVWKAFQKNQGLLLSGALAYYILLSVIPLFTFLLLMLSHVVDQSALFATLRRYIGLVIPGELGPCPWAGAQHPRASRGRGMGGACRDVVL